VFHVACNCQVSGESESLPYPVPLIFQIPNSCGSLQAVADAYYVLSEPVHRRKHDALLAAHSFQDRSSDPSASDNSFSQFARFFSSAQSGGARRPTEPEEDEATPDGERQRQSAHAFAEGRSDAEGVFGNVFEEVSFCAVYGLGMQRADALFD